MVQVPCQNPTRCRVASHVAGTIAAARCGSGSVRSSGEPTEVAVPAAFDLETQGLEYLDGHDPERTYLSDGQGRYFSEDGEVVWDQYDLGEFMEEAEPAYLETAVATSVHDSEMTLQEAGYSEDSLSDEGADDMHEDLREFTLANLRLVDEAREADPDYGASQFAHDYWLTRNGHGAGFWDRGLGDVGDRLTESAKEQGGASLVVGDGGQLYLER